MAANKASKNFSTPAAAPIQRRDEMSSNGSGNRAKGLSESGKPQQSAGGKNWTPPSSKPGSSTPTSTAQPTGTTKPVVPKNKATSTSTPFKNDPMMDSACVIPDHPVLVPLVILPTIKVDLSGYPSLVRATYDGLSAADAHVKRFIPESVFAYYCNQHLIARLIAIRVDQGVASPREERHLREFTGGDYPVPGIIDLYLRSIGEFAFPNGKRYKLDVRDPYDLKLVQIDCDNHFLFSCHPFPLLDLKRILADIEYTEGTGQKVWDIPILTPAHYTDTNGKVFKPGLPTGNLFGYQSAQRMSSDALALLESVDAKQAFPAPGDTVGFFSELMAQISLRLTDAESVYSMSHTTHPSKTGSIVNALTVSSPDGQLLHRDFDRNRCWFDLTLLDVQYNEKVDNRLISSSILFTLRVIRSSLRVDKKRRRMWSVYDWDQYQHVPEDWGLSVNRMNEPYDPTLSHLVFKSPPLDRNDFIEKITARSLKKRGLE